MSKFLPRTRLRGKNSTILHPRQVQFVKRPVDLCFNFLNFEVMTFYEGQRHGEQKSRVLESEQPVIKHTLAVHSQKIISLIFAARWLKPALGNPIKIMPCFPLKMSLFVWPNTGHKSNFKSNFIASCKR